MFPVIMRQNYTVSAQQHASPFLYVTKTCALALAMQAGFTDRTFTSSRHATSPK